MCTLRSDVGALREELRAANGKLDRAMSLLKNMTIIINRSRPSHVPGRSNRFGDGDGGSGFVFSGGGGGAATAAGGMGSRPPFFMGSPSPTATVVGGGEFGQWGGGWGFGSDVVGQAAQDSYVCGAPMGNYIPLRVSMEQQQQQHPLIAEHCQQPVPAEEHQMAHNRVSGQVRRQCY